MPRWHVKKERQWSLWRGLRAYWHSHLAKLRLLVPNKPNRHTVINEYLWFHDRATKSHTKCNCSILKVWILWHVDIFSNISSITLQVHLVLKTGIWYWVALWSVYTWAMLVHTCFTKTKMYIKCCSSMFSCHCFMKCKEPSLTEHALFSI